MSTACNNCQHVEEGLCTKDFELGFELDTFLLQEGDVRPKNKKHNTILRSMWLLSPHRKLYHWESISSCGATADYKQHDCCGLPGYFTGWLLPWKEGSGVCSTGSASTSLSLPGSRINSTTLSLSFCLSIPLPLPILSWKQNHSSAFAYQNPILTMLLRWK